MKGIISTGICLALVLGLTGEGRARAKAGSPPPPKVLSTVKLNANNWEIWIDNRGRHTVPMPGAEPGGIWPKGSGRNYLFGGGIWVGTINRGTNPPDTQVTWGYNPNSGGAEFCPCTPDGDETRYLDPSARVYLSSNPNDVLAWPERDAGGKKIIKSLQDSWTIFSDVNPIYMVTPDRPIGVEVKRITYAWPYPGYSDNVFFLFWVRNSTGKLGSPRTLTDVILGNCMDCDIGSGWSEVCSLDNTPYRGKTRNLAMQYQTYQEPGWSIPPPYFVGFKFFEGPINNTGQTISIRSQPTIGYPEFDHDILPGELLGMTAFQIFDISQDPSTPGERYLMLSGRNYRNPTLYNAYQKDTFGPSDKRFLQCSGPFNLAPDSMAMLVVGVIGGRSSSQIVKNGDKAQDIFDSEFVAPFPPAAPNLTAIPGDHQVTLFWDSNSESAMDPYYPYVTDSSERRHYKPYDLAGYKVYKARNNTDLADPERRFLLAHFDKADGFTIVRDAQPIFREHSNGRIDTLIKEDTLGADNGLRYSFVDSGQVEGDSMGMVNGIPYFYGVTGYDFQYWDSLWYDTLGRTPLKVDTVRYWPGVPTTMEGNATDRYVIAVPRTPPSDQWPARMDSANWVAHGGAYPNTLKYFPSVVNPDSATHYPYRYRYEFVQTGSRLSTGSWGDVLPVYNLKIKDVTNHRYSKSWKVFQDSMLALVEDTVALGIDTSYAFIGRLVFKPGKTVIFRDTLLRGRDTLLLNTGIQFDLVDTLYYTTFLTGTTTVVRGSYPFPFLGDTTKGPYPPPRYAFQPRLWQFRGSLFKITWHRGTGSKGDSLWIGVRDSTNQVDVPLDTLASQRTAYSSGWCFGGNNTNARGKPYLDSSMVSYVGAVDTIPISKRYPGTWLTLCGRRYWFYGKMGGYDGRPMFWSGGVCPINDGDIWLVQQDGDRVPCDGNWLEFQPIPSATVAGGRKLLDAIKVVPNPYLVRNNWDTDKLDKHLMFTHLPTKCTIRIYTLAGDLVKIIYHDGSQNSFAAMGGTTPVGGTGGVEFWNLLTYNDQLVASGMYLFHVEAPGIGNKIGKFAIIQ